MKGKEKKNEMKITPRNKHTSPRFIKLYKKLISIWVKSIP